MAAQVVSYALDDGVVVQFEVEPNDSWTPVGAEQVIGKVKDALEPAVGAAKAVLDGVTRLAPGDIEVKFGIKVSGGGSWLVAKASSDASFEVTVKWHPAHGSSAASPAEATAGK